MDGADAGPEMIKLEERLYGKAGFAAWLEKRLYEFLHDDGAYSEPIPDFAAVANAATVELVQPAWAQQVEQQVVVVQNVGLEEQGANDRGVDDEEEGEDGIINASATSAAETSGMTTATSTNEDAISKSAKGVNSMPASLPPFAAGHAQESLEPAQSIARLEENGDFT
eukprot:SAG31_NODE_2038_length_6595_cov_2.210437_2_plen_168_part_00